MAGPHFEEPSVCIVPTNHIRTASACQAPSNTTRNKSSVASKVVPALTQASWLGENEFIWKHRVGAHVVSPAVSVESEALAPALFRLLGAGCGIL